jgi:glycosyltransferase involved in cell wall biosynthesis
MQPELRVRKILGRTYLNENRLAEALDTFIKILIDYPDDLETLLILGGFYLASGDGKTAKSLYLRAQELDPQNQTIQRQIMMADETAGDGVAEPVPTDMEAVARLLQRLTGKTQAVDENDIVRAAQLLEKIINSENPAELVSRHLDEIDELLVALIELNIRQAQADGRPDVAEALHGLQLNIGYQRAALEESTIAEKEKGHLLPASFAGNVLMLLPDLEKKSNRMKLLRVALESSGCQVLEKDEYVPAQDRQPDVVFTSNPHTNPALLEGLAAVSNARIPILLDLDTDVEHQSVSHQEYSAKGLSTQTRGNAYTAALDLANMISVPSQMQAASLKTVAERVFVIPDGWSRQNKLWEKSPAPHGTINIGWAGSSGQLEDLLLVRRFIIRIIREFPNTRIVIIGNPQAYRLFDGLPENRRMYLPLVADEEFPHLLSQLDMLLVPLRNLPFNLSLPDTPLVEAGAKGIPWIASPIPAFRSWNAGGIISESLDEWHLNLRHLVLDAELRNRLGRAGKDAAQTREMRQLASLWLELITQATTLNPSLWAEAEADRELEF